MLPFAEELDVDKIHVQSPSAVVFLCGGPYSNIDEPVALSLRDGFLKILDNPAIKGKAIIQAEDITKLHVFADAYEDVLQFETDLAEISDLVLLFCESEGSMAELGAFCVIQEIASRLLVVVRDRHWRGKGETSFIRLGPLRSLERKHGNTSIFVIDDADVGDVSAPGGIKIAVLKDQLQAPLKLRLATTRDPTTFNVDRPGHIIKLIVGLIQEYGALTFNEIDELLLTVGFYVPTSDLKRYLLCAESVEWIVRRKKGLDEFFIATPLPDAAVITTKTSRSLPNKGRRRFAIREHWKDHEPLRYSVITQFYGSVA